MTQSTFLPKYYALLLLFGILCGIFSSVIALEQADYLSKLFIIKNQVQLAIVCQTLMAIIYTLKALCFYPLIKANNPLLALGYMNFRLIGAIFLYVGIISLLALLYTSQTYLTSSSTDMVQLKFIGELLRRSRDWFNHITVILPWTIGGLFLYISFHKMQLLPNWLTFWGMFSSSLTLIVTLMFILDITQIVGPIYLLVNLPAALFEIVLAVYLLSKGFIVMHIEA